MSKNWVTVNVYRDASFEETTDESIKISAIESLRYTASGDKAVSEIRLRSGRVLYSTEGVGSIYQLITDKEKK